MKQIKRIFPFFFAVLLLSASILIPIFLSDVQDKALLHGVKTEAVSKESDAKTNVSMLHRLEVLCDPNKRIMMARSTEFKGGDMAIYLEYAYVQKIIKELEQLQTRGGFPDFNLRRDLKFTSDTLGKITFISEEGWELPIYELSFAASDIEFRVRADANTYKIYEYKVMAPAAIRKTVDKQTVSKVFSEYLSISTKQFRTFYSFTNKGMIHLALREVDNN